MNACTVDCGCGGGGQLQIRQMCWFNIGKGCYKSSFKLLIQKYTTGDIPKIRFKYIKFQQFFLRSL